jgi:hypothetical protein
MQRFAAVGPHSVVRTIPNNEKHMKEFSEGKSSPGS